MRFASRSWLAVSLAAVSPASCRPAPGRNHSVTELQSTGPDGGNATVASNYRGASADGTRVFLQTTERWSPPTPTPRWTSTSARRHDHAASHGPERRQRRQQRDLPGGVAGRLEGLLPHRREAGGRRHRQRARTSTSARAAPRRSISTGPSGGNGAFNVVFDAITRGRLDGPLRHLRVARGRATPTPTATSTSAPAGPRRELSIGPTGGNGAFDATFAGASRRRRPRLLHDGRAARQHGLRRDAGRLRARGRHDHASLDRPGGRQRQRSTSTTTRSSPASRRTGRRPGSRPTRC